jgi:hypothetical protein
MLYSTIGIIWIILTALTYLAVIFAGAFEGCCSKKKKNEKEKER